jgi:hypothetical protein
VEGGGVYRALRRPRHDIFFSIINLMAIEIQISEDEKCRLGGDALRIQKGGLYKNKAHVKYNSFLILSVLEILHRQYRA